MLLPNGTVNARRERSVIGFVVNVTSPTPAVFVCVENKGGYGKGLAVLVSPPEIGLLVGAILATRVGHAGDDPLTIRTSKGEQVRPAVVHLAID